jgi:hypothetical protein
VNQIAMKALAQQLTDEQRYPANERSWAALRTTTVRNGRHITIYSILGVMADIYIRAKQAGNPTWEETQLDAPHKFIIDGTKEDSYTGLISSHRDIWILDIPNEVLSWYGITREQSTQFCMMCMRGYSFAQVGKAIMKEVEKANERRVA